MATHEFSSDLSNGESVIRTNQQMFCSKYQLTLKILLFFFFLKSLWLEEILPKQEPRPQAAVSTATWNQSGLKCTELSSWLQTCFHEFHSPLFHNGPCHMWGVSGAMWKSILATVILALPHHRHSQYLTIYCHLPLKWEHECYFCFIRSIFNATNEQAVYYLWCN